MGFSESRRWLRDTFPELYITEYTLVYEEYHTMQGLHVSVTRFTMRDATFQVLLFARMQICNDGLFSSFMTLKPRIERYTCMSLKYVASSEPLHISAKAVRVRLDVNRRVEKLIAVWVLGETASDQRGNSLKV